MTVYRTREVFTGPVTAYDYIMPEGAIDIKAPSGEDLVIQMGDALAANKISFTDSAGAEVAWIDSDGTASFGGLTSIDSLIVDREEVTADTTTDGNSFYFGCDTVGADTITLQTADTVAGRIIVVKDEGGNATAQNITIDTQAGALIDGAVSITLNADDQSVTLISNGTNWFII